MSDAVVNYFLVDLDVESHFVAMRRYLLLEDGEYMQSLTDQLFNKVSWTFALCTGDEKTVGLKFKSR